MINKLPFKGEVIKKIGNIQVVKNDNKELFLVIKTNQLEYNIYNDLINISNYISKDIYNFVIDEYMYLVFDFNDIKTEKIVKINKGLDIFDNVFEKSSFEVTLKKKNIVNLNKLYQILDSKFTYFEFRIREIETSVFKNDLSWIVLSKYNILLDAQVFLYDLQQDIFKYIDKEEVVKYGIIFKYYNYNLYQKGKNVPILSVYNGPKSMMYARYFLTFSDEINLKNFKEKLDKLDIFDQKYFCFMVIYIYILNVNFDINFNTCNINNYLVITKKINEFLKVFYEYMKK